MRKESLKRVAAIYDIHANLPALEAVLQAVRQERVDQIVIGGDVIPGPMPRETLKCLLNLDIPVQFICGNGELAILAQMAAMDGAPVSYWGTTSGNPLPEPYLTIYRWSAQELKSEYQYVLARWQKTLQLEIDGLGQVLFCHSTPRSETDLFTRLTSEERLLPIFEKVNASVVVCGHTHMQFDRMVGKTRVVNAGSVGEPFGETGAYWLMLGPSVELRHTQYNLAQAAERIRATNYPRAQEFAERDIQHPPPEREMLEIYSRAELK